MNFKQWLISEEEEKDINLSNPNLTSTIPPLNTSLSNPNLTTTIPSLNNGKKTSSERLEELAYYFGRKGRAPSQYEDKSLAKWLYNKKNKTTYRTYASDKVTWDKMVARSKSSNWIDPVTKEPFLYKDLPIDWHDVKNKKQEIDQENQKTTSKRLEELAYYYGRKGSGPSTVEFIKENKSLAEWLSNKKRRNPNPNPHEAPDITWAKIVALSKNWNKEELPYNLPENWRIIGPAGEKSLGEKLVANILKELGIENEPEYRDAACFNQRCLPFDISIKNNGKKYLEFHGKQHYYPTYFGSTEGMTDQVIATYALNAFEIQKKNDTIKYDHCEREKIPFLVIPYWLYKTQDIIKSTIIEFLKTNEFNETFANPVVPQKNKEYHDKIYAKYLAESKPTELVDPKPTTSVTQEPTKTTFEQFLINKNFINI